MGRTLWLDDRRSRLEREREVLQKAMGQAQADEADALRLAKQLAKHGIDLSGLPRDSVDWIEVVRAVLKRVTVEPQWRDDVRGDRSYRADYF